MKPQRRSELEDQGYERTGAGRCGNCQKAVEWYATPNGAKLAFIEIGGMLHAHHINDCKKQPLQPSGPPETNGSRTRQLQECLDLARQLSIKLDALIAKERF
jgi:hypothetical protein